MFTRGKKVSAKTMGSESCKRIWHPVWASSPFCCHESLSWVLHSHCDRSFLLCVPTLYQSELCWVLVQTDRALDFLLSVPTEKSAALAQGEQDPEDGAHGRQEHPTETWLSPVHTECNTEHGLQLSVWPQEWGKDISQGPEVTERTGQALPQWLKHSQCVRTHPQGQESCSWRNKWFEMLFVFLPYTWLWLLWILPIYKVFNSYHNGTSHFPTFQCFGGFMVETDSPWMPGWHRELPLATSPCDIPSCWTCLRDLLGNIWWFSTCLQPWQVGAEALRHFWALHLQ